MRTIRRSLSLEESQLIENIRRWSKAVHHPGFDAVFGCWHFPFHNQYLLESAINILADLRDQGRLRSLRLIGDIADMHNISRHGKGKIKIDLTLEDEYRLTNVCLDALDEAAGSVEKDYFYGNHEDWYHQAMSEVDMRKLGKGTVKSPTEALRLLERGYRVQDNWKDASVTLGDLLLIHGEFHGKQASTNHLHTFKQSVMFAHTHRMGVVHHGNVSAYNIGWGGDSSSPVFGYATRAMKNDWRNGFALVQVDENHHAHVQQLSLINNRVYFDGKRY